MSNEHQPGSPVCWTCNDTHVMELHSYGGDSREVMCTRCPTPCQKCRAGGVGAFCEHTPCSCDCHGPSRQPGSPGVDLDELDRLLATHRTSTDADAVTDAVVRLTRALPRMLAELRTLRARVGELEAGLELTERKLTTARAVVDEQRARITDLEAQLAAAREEQGLLKSFEAMLVKRNAEHERYVELRLSIGVAFGDVSWKASDGEEFGPLPTLPALLRAILAVEKGGPDEG